jgi:hypothetical protein
LGRRVALRALTDWLTEWCASALSIAGSMCLCALYRLERKAMWEHSQGVVCMQGCVCSDCCWPGHCMLVVVDYCYVCAASWPPYCTQCRLEAVQQCGRAYAAAAVSCVC